MVARSRVRLSRLLGVSLPAKLDWYLGRSRATRRRERPRRDPTDYRLPQRAERSLREQYRIRGRVLRSACAEAVRRTGEAGDSLVELLERRLDTLVWRAGFAPTIQRARRLVAGNHFTVDGEPVDVPSYELRPGQVVEARPAKTGKVTFVLGAQQRAKQQPPPPYVEVEPDRLRVTLTREPRRDEVPMPDVEQIAVQVRTGR